MGGLLAGQHSSHQAGSHAGADPASWGGGGAYLAVAACCLRTRLMSATKPCTSSARRKSNSLFSASSAAHLAQGGSVGAAKRTARYITGAQLLPDFF